METEFSWRYGLAFLVTVTAALLVLYGTRLILTEPPRTPAAHLMHVSLASPPAPTPPKVQPKPPKPVLTRQPARRTPVETSPHAIGPPAPTNAPLASQNATPTPPEPTPSAETANVSLENVYLASVNAAVDAQKRYPTSKDARLQHPSGTVIVWLTLDRSGALVESGIENSGGSILDRAALESVHRASYPPFPDRVWPSQTQHRFIVSLYFHQD